MVKIKTKSNSDSPTSNLHPPIPNLKIAIVHYWLDSYRGGEKVIEALCELFTKADIYTHIYKSENLPKTITSHKVTTSFISKLPFAFKYYRHYLPLMPIASRLLNLKKYDLIISSESGPAKGIRKRKGALHICYCHSPMRYVWDMEKDYVRGLGIVARGLWRVIACYMRWWDRRSAKNVDYFIANSKFIAARIRKFYKRKATVIHPPVDVNKFDPNLKRGDFYLCVSQLVSYKKVDLVVRTFNESGLPLVLIGGGSELGKIRSIAKANIQILGKVSDAVLKEKMETCKAFVYAGKEDFGIVFTEAQSAGAPIIAFGKGGVLDIVENMKSGILFKNQDVKSLMEAIDIFDKCYDNLLSSTSIGLNAEKFDKENFISKISCFVESKLGNKE
ncbi:MAG: glycosyltransferase family 4 protein [bacterium]|nr:glycosyltransferase family 4 protein [bacterium]